MNIKYFLFIFSLSLIVRIGYVWFFVQDSSLILEDQMMYAQLGKVMFETGEFLQNSENGYVMVTDRLPGYTMLIAAVYALFGENNMAIVAVQVVIDSLTCVIIALLVESIISRGFIIAGVVSAFNLNMIILSGMVLTDTLFLFLFSIFILLACRYIERPNYLKLLLAVSALSLSILVRSVAYYLIFFIPLLIIWLLVTKEWSYKKIIYSLLLYLIPIVITLGPIHSRNYSDYNSLSLVSQGGSHALYWVVPATYQYSGQGSYQEGQELARARLKKAIHKDGSQKNESNPFKNSSYQLKIAKEIITDMGMLNVLHAWSVGSILNVFAPSAVYAPVVRQMEHPSFYKTSGNGVIEKIINYIFNASSFKYLSIIFISFLTSLSFVIVCAFGFYKMMKAIPRKGTNIEFSLFLFLFFLVVYFLAITGPIVGVKYRLPFEPILIIYFSYAFLKYRKYAINYVK